MPTWACDKVNVHKTIVTVTHKRKLNAEVNFEFIIVYWILKKYMFNEKWYSIGYEIRTIAVFQVSKLYDFFLV